MVGKVGVEPTNARLQDEVSHTITSQFWFRNKGFIANNFLREQTNQRILWESHPLSFFIIEMLYCRAK